MTDGREEPAELLRRAGLEVVEGRDTGALPPPRVAWRSVAAYDAVPTVAVRDDRPDPVAELNAQWHRLAVAHGVLGEHGDGEFLVHVGGSRAGTKAWTRVRLTERWDLAGVLGDRPGRPEFVTLSPNGAALLGATCEEYDVWLIAVDRFAERWEEAAGTAARETPQEREATWEALSWRIRPSEGVRRAWADGLALNGAAPEDVLRRLLGRSATLFRRRDLPPAVVDAAVAHPDRRVRGRLAEAQPDMTAEQWAGLVLDEPDPEHRYALAALAADRCAELTGTGYRRLAGDPDPCVRAEAAHFPGLPVQLLTTLATDPDPRVRASACPYAWPHLDAPTRRELLADPDDGVRTAALLRHHEDHPMPPSVFATLGPRVQAAARCLPTPELAEDLSHHGDPALRRALASNPHLAEHRDETPDTNGDQTPDTNGDQTPDTDCDGTPEALAPGLPAVLAALADDPDDQVRLAVSVRPELTEEQRASIRTDIDPRQARHVLPWVAALHDDPDAMRRCAASSHLLVRSSVARARHLPPDVVARLAHDEDHVVRLFLAESCDDAPADLLLEVWRWWTGSFSHPGRPRNHRNFPRRDLLRYAGDPLPRMRQLALDDPESTPALVESFSRDGAAEVRLRAAVDPRLSAASAVRLLDDPHERVRRAAAEHPQLPARVLIRLLQNPETAPHAARNPALPVPVMHRLLDPATGTGAGGDALSPG
ncbi:PE-PGRS family protein [Streptomyces chattanoogensis]|uniref:PE-PGRS family protein n=1 Tax=Streptomyces chattanoogensis TaxID=66876 RepID=UPI0036749855